MSKYPSISYKGHKIHPTPALVEYKKKKKWDSTLHIDFTLPNGDIIDQMDTLEDLHETQEDAIQFCIQRGKDIIDQYLTKSTPRKPGYWKGKAIITQDFDEIPENIQKAFQGKEEDTE